MNGAGISDETITFHWKCADFCQFHLRNFFFLFYMFNIDAHEKKMIRPGQVFCLYGSNRHSLRLLQTKYMSIYMKNAQKF